MKNTIQTQSAATPFQVTQATSGHITAHQLGLLLGCLVLLVFPLAWMMTSWGCSFRLRLLMVGRYEIPI